MTNPLDLIRRIDESLQEGSEVKEFWSLRWLKDGKWMSVEFETKPHRSKSYVLLKGIERSLKKINPGCDFERIRVEAKSIQSSLKPSEFRLKKIQPRKGSSNSA